MKAKGICIENLGEGQYLLVVTKFDNTRNPKTGKIEAAPDRQRAFHFILDKDMVEELDAQLKELKEE